MDRPSAGVMVPVPERGRRFTRRSRVGLGDVDPTGRLRLDALARYLQDVASADADDARIGETFAWVVRKLTIDLGTALPCLAEEYELTTFCGGYGSRWAERRTQLLGPRGIRIECVAIWVSIHPVTGRPAVLTDVFHEVFGEAAAGRVVSARLRHPDPSTDAATRAWPLRRCDVDTLGHVNNAAHWQAVEEVIAGRRPTWAEIEFREGLVPETAATQRVTDDGGTVRSWLCNGDVVRSSAVVLLDSA